MSRLLIAAGAALAMLAGPVPAAQAEPSAAASSPVSLGYYPGWIQDELRPADIDYSPWTHIMHFGIYPNPDGSLGWDNMEPEYPAEAIEAAHSAGKQINLVIGSYGVGQRFAGATTAENRSRLVANIVDVTTSHGYDGVEIDWEENMVDSQYIALMRELDDALAEADPELELTTDVITAYVSPETAKTVSAESDWVNVMSYFDGWQQEMSAYRAVIPAEKLAVGIGLYQGGDEGDPYHDVTPQRVAAKTAYATDGGYRGVLSWALQHLDGQDDPRLWPLRAYTGSVPDCPGVSLDLGNYPVLRAGDAGAEVAPAQCLLRESGQYSGAASRVLDEPTVAAVRGFQGEVGLSATGEVDSHTWTALLSAGSTPLLREGDSGAAVARVQRALNAARSAGLTVDGVFGPNTRSAVRGYQSSRGLGVDGIVGPNTWAALQSGK
ncbi:peptidoglycan-binding protein [Amycolatopsis aidingensis]|uniref:peptidoglycan-binding protein n=1 Tax=Amycolatopsis aidingensis TaxID=2842453 RepID=UPI001E59D67B|nr:peptidoglycan-binding protein [Amycolatopsis aidingensis]